MQETKNETNKSNATLAAKKVNVTKVEEPKNTTKNVTLIDKKNATKNATKVDKKILQQKNTTKPQTVTKFEEKKVKENLPPAKQDI